MLLGAKYAPCMRADMQLLNAFQADRERERRSGCCIYHDGHGCYQTEEKDCLVRLLRLITTSPYIPPCIRC